MYSCEGQRQKKYLALRAQEDVNAHRQQEVLDGLIAEELGLDVSADRITNLAKRVINKVGEEVLKPELTQGNVQVKATDRILNAIKTGRLSELFDKLKDIPKSKLTKREQLVVKDLKTNNGGIKDIINEEIHAIINSGMSDALERTKAIKKVISDNLFGEGEAAEKELEVLAGKSESGSEASYSAPTVASSWDTESTVDTGFTGKAKSLYFAKRLADKLKPKAAYTFNETERTIVKASPDLKDALEGFAWGSKGNRNKLHKHLESYIENNQA